MARDVNKNRKNLSCKKKKILLVNISISSLLIIIVILLGTKGIVSDLFSSYNELELTKSNFSNFFSVVVKGKLSDEMGRNNNYFDTVNILGKINAKEDNYKCKNANLILNMSIYYTQYNNKEGVKEIKHTAKLDDDCKYEFNLSYPLDVIGSNAIYSYNISDLDGKILVYKK